MRGAMLLALALSVGTGCDSEPESDSEPEPESESESESEPEPDSPADALAREVWRAAGGEHLDEVAQIDFRFVVEDGGETVFEAAHRWDRRGNRDRVSWTDREGVLRDVVVRLSDRSACGHVDGEPARGEALEALAEAAYGRWVNDAYWLMVPLKVLDPGVHRRVLEGGVEAQGETRALELTFAGVGLTPGDRYVLAIDSAGRITRWEMLLEGAEPPAKGVTFEAHTEVGPLTLPLDHAVEGEPGGAPSRRVLLRDVTVHDAVQDDFGPRGCTGDVNG